MIPAPLELPPIYRGCDWPAIILVWEDQDGDPIDITNFTPYCQTVNGVDLNPAKTDAPNGATTLSMDKEQTATLKLGKFDWDWIWKETGDNGTKYPPFLYGSILVLEPKTHKFNGA